MCFLLRHFYLCIFILLFSFTAENTDAESDASSQSDGSLELFSSIPTSRITMENRELSSTELRERQTHEKSSLDKVFDEMIGSCSDEGDKTLTETGTENKKKMQMKNVLKIKDK